MRPFSSFRLIIREFASCFRTPSFSGTWSSELEFRPIKEVYKERDLKDFSLSQFTCQPIGFVYFCLQFTCQPLSLVYFGLQAFCASSFCTINLSSIILLPANGFTSYRTSSSIFMMDATTSTSSANDGPGHGILCTACAISFPSLETQRAHTQTDWQ
jgi:hypothetical protein